MQFRGSGRRLSAAALMAVCLVRAAAADPAKNVILMIGDGRGFNTVQATDYYVGSHAVYEAFPVKFGMQTSSANNPAGYNPAAMAASFSYAKSGATDSASAAAAMFSGSKIWDGDINMTTGGQPMATFFETAAAAGRSIGAVSSVEFTHATPAAVYGHNNNRDNYSEMALEAIYGGNPDIHNANYDAGDYNGNLKVVMGTGHPMFNANGQAAAANYSYVGGSQAWADLGAGVNGWTRVETKAAFQNLGTGATPDKVFGVAQNISTLQQGRSNPPGNFDPMLSNQPTLVDMTRAALNVLDSNSNGFAVMIEGGAIDWANHAGQADRMIEETIDFNNAVQAVVDWVNVNSSWNETLLIVTSDHETGYVWGDSTPTSFLDVNANGTYQHGIDYPHVDNMGAGNMPGVGHYSGSHSNSLVPLNAVGAGSELFANYVVGTEPNLRGLYDLDSTWSGQYIDNTSIYSVMMEATAVPEPATLCLFALAGLVLARRR